MPARTIHITEAQPKLGDLLPIVVGGTEITLPRDNVPLIRLVPAETSVASQPRTAGLHQGAVRMGDDFDEPLPEAFWCGTP